MMSVRDSLTAGGLYFLSVFAVAFGLGVVRTMLVAPAIGETGAVLIEVPILLLMSALVARWLLNRWALGRRAELAVVGGFAFLLLMLAEMALARLLLGQSVSQWAASLWIGPGIIGLAGQVGFAIMPMLVGLAESGKRT